MPLAPDVTVSHDVLLLAAVHAHVVDDAVTLTLPVVAPALGDTLAGASEYVHGGGLPLPGTLRCA